jgi:hypothetical protein
MSSRTPIGTMRLGHRLFLGGVGLLGVTVLITAALAAPFVPAIVQTSPGVVGLFVLIIAAWALVFFGIHLFMEAGIVSESREETSRDP